MPAVPDVMDERGLRVLLGALVGELGDEALGKMNSYDVARAVTPRVHARARELGCAVPDDETILKVANRWFSEYALAEAMRQMEEQEEQEEQEEDKQNEP